MRNSGSWVKVALAVVFLFALGFSLSAPVKAQVTGATLKGTVLDSTDKVIAGAQVSIKELSTGIARDVTTDSAGLYSAPNLSPGVYEVAVSAPGFSTQVRSGLTLTVGAQQELNITMQVGQVAQTVEVTGEAPAVQTASSEMSAEVNQATVEDLPLNGRSWTDLTLLQRGVILQETGRGGGGCTRGCSQTQLNISGGRHQQNNYRLDGISLDDPFNAGPGSQLGEQLGVDAIQEFSVVTSNFSAEYGKTSAGVVNAVTRAGTNQFHGSAFDFVRNSWFDAPNFFDNHGTPPPFRRNQFGASAGLPIQKGKTFVFGDYEGVRQFLGVTANDIVPSATARTGLLTFTSPASFPTGCAMVTATTCQVNVEKEIGLALNLFPVVAPAAAISNSAIWAFSQNRINTENYFTVRVDHTFSAKDTVAATYSFDRSPQTSPDAFDILNLATFTHNQLATVSETHIFSPSFVNTARIGYTRFVNIQNQGVQVLNPAANNPSLATVPGIGGQGIITISGGYTQNPGGVGSNLFNNFFWNTYQYYDDLFLTKGSHTIKFGGAFEHDQQRYTNSTQPGGIWTFGSIAQFLQNQPSNLQAQIPGTLNPRHVHQNIVGVYVQDDWRFRPNLTFNLGLRWEMSTVPFETSGQVSNLVNLTSANARIGNPWFANPTKRNFEPRVGFAWDPFKDGKSSLRGGFGIFDVLPLYYEFTSEAAQPAPFFEVGTVSTFSGAEPFPSNAYASLAGNPKTFRALTVEPYPRRNYVMQWNLDLQHQITQNLSISVGYVGSRGIHNPFHSTELDSSVPTLTSAGWLFPLGAPRFNTNWGNIKGLFWMSDSQYHSLGVQVQKRMAHGLQVQGIFTWSKSLDDSSSSQEGNGNTNSIQAPQFFDLKHLYYGPSDFNIGRAMVINGLWQVPSMKTGNALLGAVSNGWQFGGIFKINDGPPFSATWGSGANVDGSGASVNTGYVDRLTGGNCNTLVNVGNATNYVKTQCFELPQAPSLAFYTANCNPKFAFPVCSNLRGNAGRNFMNAPGLINVDFSMFKNNYIHKISENFNAQFRFEIFNIFNRTNFSGPGSVSATTLGSDIFNSNGSVNTNVGILPPPTVTNSRQLQFALKLIW